MSCASSGLPRFGGGLASASVVVTGASGFIGAHLCRRLVDVGARVTGVSRTRPSPPIPGMEWVVGDLADSAVAPIVLREAEPEVVFHLASHVAGSRAMDFVLPTFESNLLSTIHMLRAATGIGCRRVVLTGSMEEPGEEDPGAAPASPYAAAKWAATGYAKMFHALYETPVALARVFMVYGPGQRDGLKLIPYVIRLLMAGRSPELSSGVRPVDWVYVDDVVDGLLAMGEGKGPLAVPVDLGSGTLVTVRSVVELLGRLVGAPGKARFGAIPDRPREQVQVADLEASFGAIGWRPQVLLEEGLRRTVEWYRFPPGLGGGGTLDQGEGDVG